MRSPGIHIICATLLLLLAGMRPGAGKSDLQDKIDDYTNITYAIDSLQEMAAKLESTIRLKKKDLKKLIQENESVLLQFDGGTAIDSTLADTSLQERKDSLANVLTDTKSILAAGRARIAEYREEIVNKTDLLDELADEIILQSDDINESAMITYRDIEYLVFKADLDEHEINFHLLNPEDCSGLHSLKNAMSTYGDNKNEVLMATNAGMYTEERLPQGLYIENYEELKPLDTRSPQVLANFYLMPNGVFFMDENGKPFVTTTQSFVDDVLDQPKPPIIRNATQSGPMLVIDGELHDAFMYRSKNLHIRNGVGVKDEHTVYFAMSLQRTNFHDFGTVFKDFLGCPNALYLDGAISRMYVSGHAEKDKGGRFGPMISVVRKTPTSSPNDN